MVTVYLARGEDGRALAPTLLERAAAELWGLPLPGIARLPGGKPWFPARPGLHFSLSHSGPLALCAAGDAPVGADVERVRPRSAGLPRYVCSAGELAWFEGRGERWEDFYTLWTLKEARCKCTGEGLRRGPRALRVPLLEPGEAGALDGFAFRAWGGPGWRAAACVERGALCREIVQIS